MIEMQEGLPIVLRLPNAVTAERVFRSLAERPHCVFLDSSLRDPGQTSLARYSFLACDPYHVVTGGDGGESLAAVRAHLQACRSHPHRDLPPFQGGAAGVLTYELSAAFESVPAAAVDEFQLPPVTMGLYDVVIAFDHVNDTAVIISQGFPETDPAQRRSRAQRRAAQMQDWIDQGLANQTADGDRARRVNSASDRAPIKTPHVRIAHDAELYSNFSRDDYLSGVRRVVDNIRDGEIFQANLSQRLLMPATIDSPRLMRRLRAQTPSTFGGYFDAGKWQVMTVSPERFLHVRDRRVESRPIKGTRQQTQQPIVDLFAAEELVGSLKDRRENVMIVDLIRNDLSRVCTAESVQVDQLCGLEQYGYVQHLVSSVVAELQTGRDVFDLLAATFPGGSITGAPKCRAMEIIGELERVARGPYCGSLGYINWNGDADFNLLIRTVTAAGGWWQFPVGGGIVADSVPQKEYDETWHKAEGLLRALRPR